MLSVLIVNWNTRDMLAACLSSIFKFPPKVPFEVIVVDNGSSDGSADMVKAQFPQVDLIRLPNLGYARGNNVAYERSKGDLVLTLNPDTEVFADTFDCALASAAEHLKQGAFGARQIGTDGEIQRSIRGFPTPLGIFGALTGLDKRFPRSVWGSYSLPSFDFTVAQPAPQPMGTFLMLRREAIEAVSANGTLFDEQFPIFFNEVDLLYRLKMAGWPCLYDPSIQLLHHGGESTKQVRKSMIWESHRSLRRYLSKHTKGFARLGLPFFSALIWIAALVRARGYSAGFRP